MSKFLKKMQATLKSYWHHHKVWSVIIGFIVFTIFVSPVISALIGFVKDGTNPITSLKNSESAEIVVGLVFFAICFFLYELIPSGGGSPKGDALSDLENRSSVHPQSDYRAQDRAAQEARDAAAQGREALNALERAGGDPATMQKLKWEIDQADRDAKTFQEWADD
jgi:hypothetical protein